MFEVVSGKIETAKKVVLYGPEGIGKTLLAANFPKPIFIDTEGSTKEYEVDRLKRPTSWTMLQQQVDWVKTQGHRFKTLVIDTIDWAEMLCIESVCAAHGKKGIEDFGYGNGYIYVAEEFGRFLNKLSDVIESGINVVLTAHAQIRKFEQPDEMGAYDRWELKLGKKTSSQTSPLVKEWADMILFLNYKTFSVATDKDGKKFKAQGGERVMYTTHHPAWDAKNRYALPAELPLDYSQIAHIFNEQAISQVQETWTTQDPEQHEQITQQVQQPQQEELTPGQAKTTQQSVQQNIEQTPVSETPETIELDPSIPKALRDLMIQHNVTEADIQMAVSEKGYYPLDTPIANYDTNFIDGVLIAAWDQVYQMIKELRDKIPFN